MKKILHICNSSFYLKNFLKTHIHDLVKNNYKVHVICNIDNKNFSLNKKVILHNVKFPKSISPYEFFLSIIRVNKLIKSFDFDCVISHNRNASIAGRIATFFSKVPINLYFAHGFYFHDNQNFFSYLISIQIERFLQKITSHTISQSQEDINLMVEKKYIDKKKITHVGNGIDVFKFRPVINNIQLKKKLGLPLDSFIITGVGRLVKGKGFQNLIDAFYQISKSEKNCFLMIVGGVISQDISRYEKKILKKIKKMQIEKKVILTGMVENVEDYLNCSDIYVLSSFREGISRSMLEAMSCKIPVISTNIRGSREIIIDNYNGLLYEKNDIRQLVLSILKLKNNKKLVKKIIFNAYDLVYKFYNEIQYNKRQLEVIKKYV